MPEAFVRAVAGRLSPLRTRLVALVSVSVVPVVIVSVIGMALIENQQRRSVESDLVQTARALSSAVDGELVHSVAALQMLATAPSLQQGEVERFIPPMQKALPGNPQWVSLELFDRSGRVINRVGEAAPPSTPAHAGALHSARETAQPAIGSLRQLPSGEFRFVVHVPVLVDGEVRYMLSATVKLESLLPVLQHQKVETGGVVAVIDSNLLVVARTRAHEKFIGRPATPDLRALLNKADEGWTPSVALDNVKTYVAFSRSAATGWAVLYGVTRDSIDKPLRSTYAIFGVGVLLSLALGIGAAALVARQIASSIFALKRAASDLEEGRAPVMEAIPISELDEMAQALSQAADARLKAEASRDMALSEAHSANAEKDALLALLSRSNAELQRFAYVASHDLQAPLRSVTNFAELLERGAGERLTAQERDWLQRVTIAGRHMQNLIKDLLSYARLEAAPLEPSEVDLNQVLKDTLELIGGLVQESGAQITQTVLPTVMGHRPELQQLMLNLLTNSIHYRSEAPLRIEVSAKRAGGTWQVSVRDNGIGIDPRHHREIFDIFRRLDPSRPGTGIGLALCRRIVERMGGTIWLDSELGRGATFTFSVPAAPGH
jgi:signal transduction histidine kinase